MIYSAHLCGCFLYYIGNFVTRFNIEESWLDKSELSSKSMPEQYINCVYYSVLTMITAGIAQIDGPIQKLFSIFLVIIVSGIFGYFISTIGIILQDMSKLKMDLKYIFSFLY